MSKNAEKNPDEKLNAYLNVFDKSDLENEYARRMAFKPLYDYMQTLILETAVYFCGQNKNCLRNQGLEARWNTLKNIPSLMDDSEKWEQFIRQVQNLRSAVEHNDDYFPEKSALATVRKQIPEFTEWLVATGRKYYDASRGFSFIQEYSFLSHRYVLQADCIIDQYGEQPPFLEGADLQENDYSTVKPLKEKIASRVSEIKTIEDLQKEDFTDLIQLVIVTERLEALESAFLHFRICPKCGAKIVETHRNVGGRFDDEPTAVVYRVGCEKCDYELNNETIEF
jgi:hypothetical protein